MSNPTSPQLTSFQRSEMAKAEIEAVLKKYDLAGVVGIHAPGVTHLFLDLSPSYSCLKTGSPPEARTPLVVLPLSENPDPSKPHPDILATEELLQGLSDVTLNASFLFQHLSHHFEVKTRITK